MCVKTADVALARSYKMPVPKTRIEPTAQKHALSSSHTCRCSLIFSHVSLRPGLPLKMVGRGRPRALRRRRLLLACTLIPPVQPFAAPIRRVRAVLRASDAEDIDAEAARIAEMRTRMEGMFSGAEAPAAPAAEDRLRARHDRDARRRAVTDAAGAKTNRRRRAFSRGYATTVHGRETPAPRPRHATLDAAGVEVGDEGAGRGAVSKAGGPGRPRRRPAAPAGRQHPGRRELREQSADLRDRRRYCRAVLRALRVRVFIGYACGVIPLTWRVDGVASRRRRDSCKRRGYQ